MKQGFTLSEVLITLGIVGIVAVLTIPGVMKNYKNRLYTAQLEKTYAQIADAAQSLMNDEHVDNFYETTAGQANACVNANEGTCSAGIGYFLNKYFKTIKRNCLTADRSGCASSNANVYKTVGNASVRGMTGEYCIQTTAGSTICGSYNPGNHCMSIAVDVNGMAEPNVAGRDVFSMDIHKNGSISDYGSACVDNSFGATAATCTTGNTNSLYEASAGCLTNIIEAGWKMEY